MMLRDLRDTGHSDWQTVTSFLANFIMDQDNPQSTLRQSAADVKLKLNMMRQTRTIHEPPVQWACGLSLRCIPTWDSRAFAIFFLTR